MGQGGGMRAEDITDEKSLRAWLETRPRADAVAIAHRAAMRMFPLWAILDQRLKDNFDLSVFHCLWPLLVSGIPLEYHSLESVKAARSSAEFATKAGGHLFAASSVAAAAAFASNSLFASNYVGAAVSAFARAHQALKFEYARNYPNAVRAFAELASRDAGRLQRGEALAHASIWSEKYDDVTALSEALFIQFWESYPDTYDFWTRWWIGARDGKPLDWELQKRVALIPAEEWEKNDPAHIAALIQGIEDEFVRERTDNAETIAINPATGKLRLIPSTALPPNVSATARANIRAALALFGPLLGNQYRALEPARNRLESALRETPDLPTVLFDACTSAVRITVGQARLGYIPTPEQDPLIEDWLVQLRNSAADIYANDEGTRAAMANRGHVADDSALIAAQASVVEVVAPIISQSEALLQAQLPEDAETATNPNADSEERRNAAFRLASRVLRVGWFVGKSVAAGVIGEAAVQILAPVFATQAWQLFRKAIWALLGLGP